MSDNIYSYWIDDIKKFKEHFSERFDIPHCQLDIRHDYLRNIPAISCGIIQMPTQYLELLNVHCNLILSNRNIFRNIGNYSAEKLNEEKYEIPDYNLFPEDFKIKYLFKDNSITPIDKQRKKVAALLRDLISYFALYHEIGHARQLAYIPRDETGHEENQADNWENQAMEVDADIFAINWLWRTTLLNYHNFAPNAAVQTRQELIGLALYSTFLLFILSNNNEPLINQDKKHPHPIVRIEILSIFIQKILLSNILTKEEFGEVIRTLLIELKKTLTFHFDLNHRDYFDKFYADELKEVKIIIQAHLEKNPALNRNRPYNVE